MLSINMFRIYLCVSYIFHIYSLLGISAEFHSRDHLFSFTAQYIFILGNFRRRSSFLSAKFRAQSKRKFTGSHEFEFEFGFESAVLKTETRVVYVLFLWPSLACVCPALGWGIFCVFYWISAV